MMWRRDDLVDKLIANNAARVRPGMDKPDLMILARIGEAKWDEMVKAQEQLQNHRLPTSR